MNDLKTILNTDLSNFNINCILISNSSIPFAYEVKSDGNSKIMFLCLLKHNKDCIIEMEKILNKESSKIDFDTLEVNNFKIYHDLEDNDNSKIVFSIENHIFELLINEINFKDLHKLGTIMNYIIYDCNLDFENTFCEIN